MFSGDKYTRHLATISDSALTESAMDRLKFPGPFVVSILRGSPEGSGGMEPPLPTTAVQSLPDPTFALSQMLVALRVQLKGSAFRKITRVMG